MTCFGIATIWRYVLNDGALSIDILEHTMDFELDTEEDFGCER